MNGSIYLDYNATTPVDPEVFRAMEPCLREVFGNPGSSHFYGRQAKSVVDTARMQVADLIGAHPDEVVFTGGGTESNNMAILGAARALRDRGNHIITTAVEHPAVLEVCKQLEKEGFRISIAGVDRSGMVSPDEILGLIGPGTILISVMHANNEVGTIQPVAGIGRIAREKGILMHTDAAQSTGKIRVNTDELNVDLLSVAGHKLYAPKGVGTLYVGKGVVLEKIIFGADHERNHRPGTENVAGIAGLGKACELARLHQAQHETRLKELRDLLQRLILEGYPQAVIHGHPAMRLPNTLSVSIPGISAAAMLASLEGVAASAGAACHSGKEEVSGVLRAMGVPPEIAMGTIRLSTGRYSTGEEIRRAARQIVESAETLNRGGADKSKTNTHY